MCYIERLPHNGWLKLEKKKTLHCMYRIKKHNCVWVLCLFLRIRFQLAANKELIEDGTVTFCNKIR